MQLGRDVKGRANGPWSDPEAVELMPLSFLRREAAGAGLAAHQARPAERTARLLAYARLVIELARRTGDSDTLTKAAFAAERAARVAETPASTAAARLVQAEAALTGGALFCDPHALDTAASWLATPEVAAASVFADDAMALRTRIEIGRALRLADVDRALEAAGLLDATVAKLTARAGENAWRRIQSAALRCERAEFLVGFGRRLKDKTLIERAETDLGELALMLDADRAPLTSARVGRLRALALSALGDLSGEARCLAKAVRLLGGAAEQVDLDHSPLDRAQISHAMGLDLQALAEAVGDDGLYDHAVAAFDQAMVGLAATPDLPLRAVVIHDRAACVACRAERAGDLLSLERAEAEFKAELRRRTAVEDPVAWGVAQLALARVYDAKAELAGAEGPPPETAFALAEAFDVFTEKGLKFLAELAEDGLSRFREGSREQS